MKNLFNAVAVLVVAVIVAVILTVGVSAHKAVAAQQDALEQRIAAATCYAPKGSTTVHCIDDHDEWFKTTYVAHKASVSLTEELTPKQVPIGLRIKIAFLKEGIEVE